MKPKRGRGGYVMIYVMVVIVIISAMSLSVSSISLRNLQAQEASIRQLEETYAAEGMVEMFCEWLKLYGFTATYFATATADTLDQAWTDSEIGSIGEIKVKNVEPDGADSYDISITAKAYAEERNPTASPPADLEYGTMQVDAKLKITFDATEDKVSNVEYISYTVSPAEKTEGGGSGGGSE